MIPRRIAICLTNNRVKKTRGVRCLFDQDEAEFRALVLRQSRFVFRVAYAILRNAHDSEDVVQETFLKLYRNGAWRTMQDERAFLASTAWRIATDSIAARKPHASFDLAIHDFASPGRSPEQDSIGDAAHAAIHRLIDSLPEELRQVIALSAIDELNSRQIAAILSIPEGTVRTRLLRARQLLKEKIASAEKGTKRSAAGGSLFTLCADFAQEKRYAR